MNSTPGLDPTTFLQEFIQNNSAATLLLVALVALVWLLGGNLLVASHYSRLGKSPWSGFKPFAFPFKDFNSREWIILLALAIVSLGLIALALAVSPHPHR
jgi:hypothetical protein